MAKWRGRLSSSLPGCPRSISRSSLPLGCPWTDARSHPLKTSIFFKFRDVTSLEPSRNFPQMEQIMGLRHSCLHFSPKSHFRSGRKIASGSNLQHCRWHYQVAWLSYWPSNWNTHLKIPFFQNLRMLTFQFSSPSNRTLSANPPDSSHHYRNSISQPSARCKHDFGRIVWPSHFAILSWLSDWQGIRQDE